MSDISTKNVGPYSKPLRVKITIVWDPVHKEGWNEE